MNKILMSLLLGAFILTGVSFAQTPPPEAPEPAAPAATVAAHHDHYPELHKAMRKLRGAKLDLQKAAHDYDGHRIKAIHAIDLALAELRAAMASK